MTRKTKMSIIAWNPISQNYSCIIQTKMHNVIFIQYCAPTESSMYYEKGSFNEIIEKHKKTHFTISLLIL